VKRFGEEEEGGDEARKQRSKVIAKGEWVPSPMYFAYLGAADRRAEVRTSGLFAQPAADERVDRDGLSPATEEARAALVAAASLVGDGLCVKS
jgi:hypothetical protein